MRAVFDAVFLYALLQGKITLTYNNNNNRLS